MTTENQAQETEKELPDFLKVEEGQGAQTEASNEQPDNEVETELDGSEQEVSGDEKEEGDKTEQRIPKARFNEVNNARKLAEEEKDRVAKENEELRLQLARLQGAAEATANQNSKQESKPEPASIDSLYEQYNEALLIGDSEEVNKLQKEITQQLVKEASDQAKEAAKQEAKKIIEDHERSVQGKEQQVFVSDFLKNNPQLDKDSPSFNQAMLNDFIEHAEFYEYKGLSYKEAFNKALEKVTPVKAEEKKGPKEAAKLTEDQIKKQIERANKTEPANLGKSNKNVAVDFSSLTDDEFAEAKKSTKPSFLTVD